MQAMADEIKNDSMSMIHCEDLAQLHVACMDKKEASGRYFGVNRSWPWEDILKAVEKKLGPGKYKMPPKNYEKLNPVTLFDNTRRNSLGVELKGLDEIVGDTIDYLIKMGKLEG